MMLVALAALPAARVSPADAPSSEPLPISVTPTPSVVWIGSPVTLAGSSAGAGSMNSVSLQVQAPPGSSQDRVTLQATLDAGGHYTASFSSTRNLGTYTVRAVAPDGRSSANTTFRVTGGATGNAEPDVVPTAPALVKQIDEDMRQQLNLLPPSPAKDQALTRLDQLDSQVEVIAQAAKTYAHDFDALLDATGKIPDLPQQFVDERGQFLGQLQAIGQAVQQTAEQERELKRQQANCDNLDVIIEGFKLTSFMLNLAAGNPNDIGQNFAMDLVAYITGKGSDLAHGTDTDSFVRGEVAKNVPNFISIATEAAGSAARYGGLKKSGLSIASDLGAFVGSKVMSAYCVQFTGPVKAHLKAQFYRGEEKWWEYEFDLLGRVMVHYPKDATGDSIAVKGRMEGYGYNFKVWEDALRVLYPDLMSSTVIKKIVIPPVELGSTLTRIGTDYIEGSVVGARLPNAFFFEVTGTAQKNQLTLNVGATRTDMDPKARVIAYTLSPLTLALIPEVYALPYKNAHFVFERTADSYVIPLQTNGNVVSGKQHWEKETGSNAHATYSVDIQACNPGC